MASSRQLKSKIQSVKNIKQITRAMQMVAATKMRKAQEAALNARPYARHSLALLLHILHQQNGDSAIASPLMQERAGLSTKEAGKRICFVVVTSDRGLAGSFNSNILRKSMSVIEELWQQRYEVDVVTVGRKGRDFFSRRGIEPVATFTQFSDMATLQDTQPLADWILKAYKEGEYDQIHFCSTQFVSALVHAAETYQILPVEEESLKRVVSNIIPKTGKYAEYASQEDFQNNLTTGFLMEPSAKDIAGELLEQLVRVEILHLIFESNASEHSARMIAMKNATDNAENMQEELTLALNKARQAAITQEVSEISSAKEALTTE